VANSEEDDAMQARDIMTKQLITISPMAKLREAIEQMVKSQLSGLLVVDPSGALVGILSEGDLLRRVELGTERHRPRWIEAFLMPARSASDYIHAHSRIVEDVMTRDPICVNAATPLAEIVSLMERKRIKRVPVLSDGALVGIITRANLLHALAERTVSSPTQPNDEQLRKAIETDLNKQPWVQGLVVNVKVSDGIVELEGMVPSGRIRQAIRICAANIPGVKAVNDRFVTETRADVDPAEPGPQVTI
jgi:CBS domain-containing protein